MKDLFSDIFWVEYHLPQKRREKMRKVLRLLLLGALIAFFILYLFDLLAPFLPVASALFMIILWAWATAHLLESYLVSRLGEISLSHFFAGVLARGASTDAVLGFVESDIGLRILTLARVSVAAVESFKEQRARSGELAPRVLSLASSRDLRARLSEMYRDDSRFSSFLAVSGVSLEGLLAAADLFMKGEEIDRAHANSVVPGGALYLRGIGKRWSIGHAPTLHAYEKALPKMVMPHKEELKGLLLPLEQQYLRSRSAKVALVGDVERVRELLVLFAEKQKRGDTHAFLAERYPLILDTNMIVSRARDRAMLEETLSCAIHEAIRTGIFLLIIEEWDLFEKACFSFGVRARPIFEPLFTSSRVALLLSGFSGEGAVSFEVTQAREMASFQVPDALIRSDK